MNLFLLRHNENRTSTDGYQLKLPFKPARVKSHSQSHPGMYALIGQISFTKNSF